MSEADSSLANGHSIDSQQRIYNHQVLPSHVRSGRGRPRLPLRDTSVRQGEPSIQRSTVSRIRRAEPSVQSRTISALNSETRHSSTLHRSGRSVVSETIPINHPNPRAATTRQALLDAFGPQSLSTDVAEVHDVPGDFPIDDMFVLKDPMDVDDIPAPDSHASARQLKKKELNRRWNELLPKLSRSFLCYESRVQKDGPGPVNVVDLPLCLEEGCIPTKRTIICVYWNRSEEVEYTGCCHQSFGQRLIETGLFPSSPTEPHVAISIELLAFQARLFEHGRTATTALVSALIDFHRDRGYYTFTSSGDLADDPFRRPLSNAIFWYDILCASIEREAEAIVSQYHLTEAKTGPAELEMIPATLVDPLAVSAQGARYGLDQQEATSSGAPILRTECSTTLQSLCPACFMGTEFGSNDDRGTDIHVAIDCNFHQRHLASVMDGDAILTPPLWQVSQQRVDEARRRIDEARKKPRRPHIGDAPDVVVDGCEASHMAGDESKEKTSGALYDVRGVAALVCRHDVPLLWANIDTPGEGQHYSVAMIDVLFEQLPPNATVTVLYDVSCILSRSVARYEIFDSSIASRLVFVTSAMHSYSHSWPCQLVYNPRMQIGMGLSDGEGVERLWSMLHRLVGILRHMLGNRRNFVFDRQITRIQKRQRFSLIRWMMQRLGSGKHGLSKRAKDAKQILQTNKHSLELLRTQWDDQHAPQAMKRQLDAILKLQQEIQQIDGCIKSAQVQLAKSGRPAGPHIKRLFETHRTLTEEADELYSSLHLEDDYPSLTALPLEFTRRLLLTHDAKIALRQRAVARLMEFDRLDQAASGAAPALGTEEHQRTRQNIEKRTPALRNAITRYNNLCELLRELLPLGSDFPLPQPVPEQIWLVRDDQTFYEDVWLQPTAGNPIPEWLKDPSIRQCIQAVHILDRCREEQLRIKHELRNVIEWIKRQQTALEKCLMDDNVMHLRFRFRRMQSDLKMVYNASQMEKVVTGVNEMVDYGIPLHVEEVQDDYLSDLSDHEEHLFDAEDMIEMVDTF